MPCRMISAPFVIAALALAAALSENGNPTLDTLLKVMAALGMRLKCESGAAKAA